MKIMSKLVLTLAFVSALSLTTFAQRLSDQKPASLLVFNLYSSDTANPGQKDTSFSLTNVHNSQNAWVHLYFVGGNCSVADTIVCLTPKQTTSFLASDVDPGQTGFVIAMAVDSTIGCPVSFNHLIGSEFVKLSSGHSANLTADGYTALFDGTIPGCTDTSTLVTIALDGVQYSSAARQLAVDKIPSSLDGNSTLLVINCLEGNLAIGAQILGNFDGTIFNDTENGAQFTGRASCQLNTVLSNSFPVTTPSFQTLIPAGRTGWMRLKTTLDQAISGAVINFNPGAGTLKGRFNGGHNLHSLSLTSGNLTVPVFAPFC